MSTTTATPPSEFDLTNAPKLPNVPSVPIPPLPNRDQFAAQASTEREEVERLRNEFSEARRELSDLAAQESRARMADRAAHTEATLAGKPDPGEKHLDKLRKDFAATYRRCEGLAGAVPVAQNALSKAVKAHHDEWVTALREHLDGAGERLETALATIDTVLNEGPRLRKALARLETGSDRGLPSGVRVNIGGTPLENDQLFAAIRTRRASSETAYEGGRPALRPLRQGVWDAARQGRPTAP